MENRPFDTLRQRAAYLLTSLDSQPDADGAFSTTVRFSGYAGLLCTVSDLMKLCTLVLLSDEPHVSPLVGDTRIDLAAILELALQLMPRTEAEFLDEAREALQQAPVFEQPQGNYSTLVVLEPAS